ncbi:hypothetical protein WKH08_23735 [Pantoea agglomerans]|uniref:Uncharacterized protein n=1 Tax=Enterobacter agglomerans TaxID=549 RepID=A0ABD6XPS3_ENTAG|nr:hypothetical protein [Pantoea agglomerans]MDQ0627615.1 hypothetical protein [Pantoea agglomerans]NKE96709.1 hypothetical protein [Pantoea agglomerans]TRO70064.1 hypothetical protein E5140_21480 [Pantoea agglomerans]
MQLNNILHVLAAHPEHCIRTFHRGARCSTRRMEGQVLLRHYGWLIPDEIGLNDVMFLKVRDALCVTETWDSDTPGGCTYRLSPDIPA